MSPAIATKLCVLAATGDMRVSYTAPSRLKVRTASSAFESHTLTI